MFQRCHHAIGQLCLQDWDRFTFKFKSHKFTQVQFKPKFSCFSKLQIFKSNSGGAGQAAKVGAAADRTERYSASVLSYVADYGTEAGFTEACETPVLLLTTHVSFRDQHQRDQNYMYV